MKIRYFLAILVLHVSTFVMAQLPANALVGYLENWNTLKLSQAHANYNVLCLAFALPVNYPTPGYDMRFALPAGYSSAAQLMTDIDLMHSQGKVVLLSIGGATGPIMLNNATQRNTFISSINTIFSTYGNKIDGIDMDLETSGSMGFGAWTMTSPAVGQTNMVTAIQSIMATYLATNGKKMILTMAPEVIYLMGGLSTWQVTNVNGGAFLPILDGLRNELDLLHMQLYNAGGAGGGVYAWNGSLYYDDGTADFMLAMNESIIKGFTCVSGKGTFVGIPASKLAFGLPATSAASTAGTGYVAPATICNAVKYFKGLIAKPGGVTYTVTAAYPSVRGLMTWSINEDNSSINGQWNFASNYTCAFPTSLPVELLYFDAVKHSGSIELSWGLSQHSTYRNMRIEILEEGESHIIAEPAKNSQRYFLNTSDLNAGVYYFRLVFEDEDGSLQFSNTKEVKLNATSLFIPSPFLEKIFLESLSEAHLLVFDVQGTLLLEQKISAGKSEIEAMNFPAGIYWVQAKNVSGELIYSQRLVKL